MLAEALTFFEYRMLLRGLLNVPHTRLAGHFRHLYETDDEEVD